MRKTELKAGSVLFAALVTLPGWGCAKLMNPYVIPDSKNSKVANTLNAEVSLSEAIKYAEFVRTKYAKAASGQAKLNSWLGTVLIPLGATGAFIGSTSNSTSGSDAVAAIGYAGASAYGVGNWLGNKPRSVVYFEGARAISCARTAVSYLAVGSNRETQLNEALEGQKKPEQGQDCQQTKKKSLTAILEILRQGLTEPGFWDNDDEKKRIRELIQQGETALIEGRQLQLRLGQSGSQLVLAVNRINDRVNAALVATIPDLASIQGVLEELDEVAGRFGDVKPATNADEMETEMEARKQKVTLEAQGLAQGSPKLAGMERKIQLIEDQRCAISRLADRISIISGTLEVVNAALPEKSLQQCGVDIQAPSFQLQPGDRITFERAGTKKVAVTGGVLPYFVNNLSPVDGLSVAMMSEAGVGSVEIKVEDGVPEDTYHLLVWDATGAANGKIIEVEVKKSFEERLSEEQKKLIQQGVGLESQDGNLGTSREAIKRYQKAHGLNPSNGVVTEEHLQHIFKAEAEGYETGLEDEEIKQLCMALGLSEKTQFDLELRGAIIRKKVELSLDPPTKYIDSEEQFKKLTGQ